MSRNLVLTILVNLTFCMSVLAQSGEILDKKEIKKLEREGEAFYENEEYEKALKYFIQLNEISPNDPYYNLVLGICYTYIPDEKEKSLTYLEKAKKLNPDFDQVDLFLGRAYYKNHQFQKAIDTLNELIAKDESDDVTIDEAMQIIVWCQNAMEIISDTAEMVAVFNMGSIVNTEWDEYVPLIMPDESQMIFTYKGDKSTGGKLNDKGEPDPEGNYFEDIFVTLKSPEDWMYDEDIWLEPVGVDGLNTDLDDACIALSADGQTLFLYKYSKENGGDIYYSRLDGEVWGEPQMLEGDVNTKSWEGSVTLASDGQVLYFSSDRPGGEGGRDLYRAEKLEDGTWGNVTNLGPTINTPLNDDSPFLHLDRQTLYFSSQGHNSMGGYDVYFVVDTTASGNWGPPTNMGAPVNTTEDDMFYVSNADGSRGYYSSAYGSGSQGRHDIYKVTPDLGRIDLEPAAALIVGIVFADDVPTGSEITVYDVTKDKPGGTFYSNSASGKYWIALMPGSKYEIEVNVDSFPTHKDEIDLETLFEYIEVSNNIYIYSEEFEAEKQENQPMNTAVVVPVAEPEPEPEPEPETPVAVVPVVIPKDDPCPDMVDLSAFIGKNLNIESNYNNLKTEIGEYCADELEYRVQIGAYRFPQNFKYDHLNDFGDTDIQDYPDGITRFTKGSFTTLNDADDLRQQIRKAGTDDAWVIPFYDGQRIFMEDLISVNFYKQMEN